MRNAKEIGEDPNFKYIGWLPWQIGKWVKSPLGIKSDPKFKNHKVLLWQLLDTENSHDTRVQIAKAFIILCGIYRCSNNITLSPSLFLNLRDMLSFTIKNKGKHVFERLHTFISSSSVGFHRYKSQFIGCFFHQHIKMFKYLNQIPVYFQKMMVIISIECWDLLYRERIKDQRKCCLNKLSLSDKR